MEKKYTLADLIDLTSPSSGKFQIDSDNEAFSFCEQLAKQHYENFPVGSLFVPTSLRPHFYSIYAFSRIADDLGDETSELSVEKRIGLLSAFEQLLTTDCPQHPVFRALSITRDKKQFLTNEPFQRLIKAFKSDVLFTQFQTFDALTEYCHNSANPVGELLLRLFGEWNEQTSSYSNDICSALQLLNFWQDISKDLPNNRCYIPLDLLQKYSLTIDDNTIIGSSKSKQQLLEELFFYTHQLFERGIRLLPCIESKRLRMELSFIIGSAMTLQSKVTKFGIEIFSTRIKLSVTDILPIFHRTLNLYNTY